MPLATTLNKLLLLGSLVMAPAVFSATNLTVAGNGDGILYPTATNTYTLTNSGNIIQLPMGMVYVPAGNFTMGTGITAQTIYLDAYCIGKFQVTEAEYKAFVDATHLSTYPSHWTNGTYPGGKANHPIPYVSLTNALKYCAWVSSNTGWTVTVPNAEQWEKAARGPHGYLYPWGNNQDATYSGGVVSSKFNFNAVVAAYYLNNFSNSPATYNNVNSPYYNTLTTVGQIAAYDTSGNPTYLSVSASGGVNGWVNHDTWTGFIYTDVFSAINAVGGYTSAVGKYTNGVSGYGCYDMAGNLWCWTTTEFIASNGAEAGQVVNQVRGGSWYANGGSCKGIDIGEGRAGSGNFNTIGFRLVMTPASIPPPLSITSTSPLTNGSLGLAYTNSLAASGGTAPYTWTVNSGVIPAGLSLSSNGVLSGVPSAAGISSFSVQVTDSATATVTGVFSLTISAYGALDHYSWDTMPASGSAGSPFAVWLTARDAAGVLVANHNSPANITAATGTGGGSLSPIVITEMAPGTEAQIELQNVSSAPVDTTGWFIRINDNTNDVNAINNTTFTLPNSMAAGALLRITESSSNTNGGRVYFGSSMAWANTPGKRFGWIALFDASTTLRDFFAWGWTATNLANFSILVNNKTITLANQWSGAGAIPGTGAPGALTVDSFQRTGASDSNTASNFTWYHNPDNSDATTLGNTNAALLLPWASTGGTALSVIPSLITFTNGEFLGSLIITQACSNVVLTATDAASHTGISSALTIGAPLPPKFTLLNLISNHSLHVEFCGALGHAYWFEASSNLVNWLDLGSAQDQGNGIFEFNDPGITTRPWHFYRVVTP